jgi:hypothetical protein
MDAAPGQQSRCSVTYRSLPNAPQTMVRERATLLLSACLDIARQRDKGARDTFIKIYEEARAGLIKATSSDVVLGSLLAVSSMLQFQQMVCEYGTR